MLEANYGIFFQGLPASGKNALMVDRVNIQTGERVGARCMMQTLECRLQGKILKIQQLIDEWKNSPHDALKSLASR